MNDETVSVDSERLDLLAELAEAGISAVTLAHELRQPLFALQTMAQLAAARGLTIDAAEVLGVLDHLEPLLRAWGDVGRRDEARLYAPVDELDSILALLDARIAQAGATVSVDTPETLWAVGSPSEMRQVLLNLLSNALDAVASGGPNRRICVRLSSEGGRVKVDVEDSGPGVDPGVRDTLFGAFVTTKPSGLGTGLGLYVVARICRRVGGSLAVLDVSEGAHLQARVHAVAEDSGPMKNA